MDKIALGRRIREERLKLNMTQEKLAKIADLSTAYIGQIERGESSLSLDKLVLIVSCLGVTIDYIMSDSISPNTGILNNLMLQILNDRSEDEKLLAFNMVKLMFSHLDGNK